MRYESWEGGFSSIASRRGSNPEQDNLTVHNEASHVVMESPFGVPPWVLVLPPGLPGVRLDLLPSTCVHCSSHQSPPKKNKINTRCCDTVRWRIFPECFPYALTQYGDTGSDPALQESSVGECDEWKQLRSPLAIKAQAWLLVYSHDPSDCISKTRRRWSVFIYSLFISDWAVVCIQLICS